MVTRKSAIIPLSLLLCSDKQKYVHIFYIYIENFTVHTEYQCCEL